MLVMFIFVFMPVVVLNVMVSITWLADSLNDQESTWSCRSELVFLLCNKSNKNLNFLLHFCNGCSDQVVFTFDKLFSFQMSTHLFNWIQDLSGTKDIFNIGRISLKKLCCRSKRLDLYCGVQIISIDYYNIIIFCSVHGSVINDMKSIWRRYIHPKPTQIY